MVRAGSSVEGTSARASGSRRVYRESQAKATLSVATVKQIATAVAPFGVILAVTFGIQFISWFSMFHNDIFMIIWK